MKFVELVAVPSESVTAIGPVVAPVGTVVVIWVFEFTVNVALVPLNFTERTTLESLKPVPVIVTLVPITPLVGVNDVIVGAAASAEGIPISETANVVRTVTSTALAVYIRA